MNLLFGGGISRLRELAALNLRSEGFLLFGKLAEAPVAGLGLRLAKPATPSRGTIFRCKKLMPFSQTEQTPSKDLSTAL